MAAVSYRLLGLPALLFLAIVFAYPLYEILRLSVTDFPVGGERWPENYAWFFETRANRTILIRTLVTSAWVTVVCLLLGYPFAYLMTIVRRRWRMLMLAVVLLPFWTSYVVRNFSWIVILQDDGPVNSALSALGLGPVKLLGTATAVTIGMAQIMLPFMVLPAYDTMRRIDRDLLPAAATLGAPPRVAFFRVYLPLSLPGVLAGALLVFVVSLGFYITPAMLGSPQQSMLAQLIFTEVNSQLAWGRAGAMSVVLLFVTLALLGLSAWLSRRSLRRLGGQS